MLADVHAPKGQFDVVPVRDGQAVYLVVPGDRAAVHERMREAISTWLSRTPPVRQSSASLARFLMTAIEAGEVPDDDAE